jgi:hypothetical protein
MKRLVLMAAAAIGAGLLLSACSADFAQHNQTRLHSPVGADTLDLAKAAVARGEKVVDVGDWSRPDGVNYMSGGEHRTAGEIADLFKANGVSVRCVGLCGSALAEIVLNSAGCTVTPNGKVVPHLAFVPGGTRADDRRAELESARWWLEHDPQAAPSTARANLVNRLERSPDKSWRMRPDELRAEGCTL